MSKAKMMYAFDHIPVGTSTAGGNMATYAADYPFTYTSGAQGTVGGVFSDSGGVWIGTATGTGAGANFYTGAWLYPFTQYDLTKARSWFATRLKLTSNNRVVPPLAVVNSSLVYQFTLVGPAEYAWVTNQEHYVEVMIDRVNKTRTVWVDGQLAVNNVSYGAYAISATDYVMLGSTTGAGGATIPTMQFKDIYVMDDPGDGSVSRLGTQLARPLTIASGSGAGWMPSTGTITSALNTAMNTSTPSTPNVAAPGDGTPLQTPLASAVDANATVSGVLLIASGQRSVATGTIMRSTISDQATPTPNQQALNPLLFPAGSYQYGKVLGFLPNALDGSAWTQAKTTQLSLSTVAAAT
jgi:hypothetical protein